jgi:hypothetical protein
VKLVLQRANGDCGLAAMATVLEQSYEDIYIAAAKVDRKTRGRSGICFPALIAIGKILGASFLLKRRHQDEDEGLLAVTWQQPHAHPFDAHLVALGYGVIADPADGMVLPADEYLARYRATAGSFLELR